MADLTTIKDLKAAGVLVDVEERHVPGKAFVFVCGDGDRHEQIQYLQRLMSRRKMNAPVTPHLFCWNGGPLLLASGFRDQPGREFAYRQFAAAVELKPHINAVILQGHGICGAAHQAGASLIVTLRLLKQAMSELSGFIRRERLGSVTSMLGLFHLDYGNGHMRTYRFNADRLE